MFFKSREQILQLYGQRLKHYRLQQNKTQAELTALSGVPLGTLRRIERVGQGSMEDYLAMLQALGLVEMMENLIPEPAVRPKALFKQNAPRVRARKAKGNAQ